MSGLNESDECNTDALDILRAQSGANVFMIVVGCLGLWGCGTILFTYSVFRDFRYKGYFLLGCLATANFVDCFGLATLGLIRVVQMATCADPSMSRKACLIILAPYWMGYTASVAFDFVVAIDRLIYLFKPHTYRVTLGVKYTVIMVAVASIPTVCIETPSFFFLTNRTSEEMTSVCSECDQTIRTNAHTVADYVNLVLVAATASMYLALASQSKRPFVRKASRALTMDSFPHELNYHLCRYVLLQRRVLRVSVAAAMSSLLTNGMYLAAKLVMEAVMTPGQLVRYAPYVSLPLLANAAGSVLFSIWRDHVFKKRFLCVLKSCYGLRRDVIRQHHLGLSVTVLDKKL